AAAAARANAARASSGGSRSYSSGSSAPAPATPSNTVNSSAGASGMNYSVPGNCPATATSCYGHATGRIPGIWGNAYPWSQCTWYAYIRRTQLGLPAGSYLGNGTDWAGKAAALGYYVNNIPHVGAAVSFYPGQAGSAPVYGHVAVVEQVLPGNRILVSECGAVYMGVAHTRILGNASSYRYVHY
ncbi:CHAP domain-containing protein, partial [Parascardovia denticolens]